MTENQVRLLLIIDHFSPETWIILFTCVVCYRYFFRIVVTEDRLSGLSILHVHRNDTVRQVNPEVVLTRWEWQQVNPEVVLTSWEWQQENPTSIHRLSTVI